MKVLRIDLALLLTLVPLLAGVDLLQSRNRATEDGNQRFRAGKAEEALAEYDKAAQKLPSDPGVQFNRGTALYALSRFDEASEAFLRATEAKARERKAAAFYNLGNSYYQAKKWGEAVAAFKKTLAYDPADMRAKWNLELALRKKTDEDKKGDKNDKQGDSKDDKPNKDKQDQQDDKDKQAKQENSDKKGDEKSDEKKNQEQNGDKKPPEQEQAKKDEAKPPSQAQKPQGKGEGKPPEKEPRPGTDPREVEAILENLEKSPKSLEAELAKLRAAHRRPAAKDW